MFHCISCTDLIESFVFYLDQTFLFITAEEGGFTGFLPVVAVILNGSDGVKMDECTTLQFGGDVGKRRLLLFVAEG